MTFNTYGVHADSEDGSAIVDTQVSALSNESAWHKAVEIVFDACEPGIGAKPVTIHVWRVAA